MHRSIHSLVITGLTLSLFCQVARAIPPCLFFKNNRLQEAQQRPWHQPYYHSQSGQPVALIVPPTAGLHTEYGWGVTMNEMRPIYHQFSRRSPTIVGGHRQTLKPLPNRPSNTKQFGIYYLRAPWQKNINASTRTLPLCLIVSFQGLGNSVLTD